MIKLKNLLAECSECGRDWNHGHDHEAGMAKNELRDMISNASKIDQMVGEGDNLPGWVSAYISLAADYMHSVAEYLAGESSREQEPGPGYAMYEAEKKLKKEDKSVPTNYQFSPKQFDLLKKHGVKSSTSGTELFFPEQIQIELDRNKANSKFKQEFYATVPPSDEYLASQILTGVKKSLKDQVKIKDKKYFVLRGNMTKKGNFNFPNPYRK